MPFPIDISLKEYINAMENIKILQWEINQLKTEEEFLSHELNNLRNSENDPNNSTYYEICVQMETVINPDVSKKKMCQNCIRTNKEYPELFGHKYKCFCKVGNESNTEQSFFKQETSCICSLENVDILW